MRRALLLATSFFAFSASHAMAALVVTATDLELSDNKPNTTTVYVDSDRMKVVNGTDIMIYRGDLKRMWTIDTTAKTYREMTPETIQQMSGQLSAAMAQMQSQLAQLPPEQRARIEAMMKARGGPAAGALAGPAQDTVNYVKDGGNRTVGSYACQPYAKMVNGKKEEEICIAPIGSVGIKADDFKVSQSMQEMMGPLIKQVRQRSDYFGLDEMNKAIGYSGVPIESVFFDDGKPERRTTMTKIDHQPIPAAAYNLPAGLKKEDLGFPGAGQH